MLPRTDFSFRFAESAAVHPHQHRGRVTGELRFALLECRCIIADSLCCAFVRNPQVGPIKLIASATVAQVEDKIIAWMQENMEQPPARERLKFLWNGSLLNKQRCGPCCQCEFAVCAAHPMSLRGVVSVLYELGIESLSTIEMQLEPEPEPEKKEGEGGEGDEGDEGDAEAAAADGKQAAEPEGSDVDA